MVCTQLAPRWLTGWLRTHSVVNWSSTLRSPPAWHLSSVRWIIADKQFVVHWQKWSTESPVCTVLGIDTRYRVPVTCTWKYPIVCLPICTLHVGLLSVTCYHCDCLCKCLYCVFWMASLKSTHVNHFTKCHHKIVVILVFYYMVHILWPVHTILADYRADIPLAWGIGPDNAFCCCVC